MLVNVVVLVFEVVVNVAVLVKEVVVNVLVLVLLVVVVPDELLHPHCPFSQRAIIVRPPGVVLLLVGVHLRQK